MAARPISLSSTGLYWTLALAVGLLPSPDADAQAVEQALRKEWELVTGAAIKLRDRISRQPPSDMMLRQMANLAERSAIGAERALAIGDAALFDSYRTQFREQFDTIRLRLGGRAREGGGAAEYSMGVLALHGYFEPPDIAAACLRFSAALAKGYAGANFRASQCLEKQKPSRAAVLMREAADSGHPAAAELLGRACLEAKPAQIDCAWDRLTMAADAGRPSAKSVLAWMYTQGVGERSDPARAAMLYSQAASAGDASAQNNAGELYETGKGVKADPKLALFWYRKAAESGFAAAQFNLGRLYAAGTGTPRDFTQARKWLEKANQAGIAPARQLLDWMNEQTDKDMTTK